MLRAITNSGGQFIAGVNSRDNIIPLSKSGQLLCPGCQEVTIYRHGSVRVPHFAHKSTTCLWEGEPETPAHLKGKMFLSGLIHKHFPNSNAIVEYPIPETEQFADVYFEHNGNKYVIEYQCSIINLNSWQDRNQKYIDNGYIVTWIFGVDNYKDSFRQVIRNIVDYDKTYSAILLDTNTNTFFRKVDKVSPNEVITEKEFIDEYVLGIIKQTIDDPEYLITYIESIFKEAKRVENKFRELLKQYNVYLDKIPTCPECYMPLQMKKGRNGLFWGCRNYNELGCKGSQSLYLSQHCMKCNQLMSVTNYTKGDGDSLVFVVKAQCSNPGCSYREYYEYTNLINMRYEDYRDLLGSLYDRTRDIALW